MSKKIVISVFFCLLGNILPSFAQDILMEEAGIARKCTERWLMDDVSFLSSELLEGRGTAERGGTLASFYLMESFRSLGLHPFGGSYSMSFPVKNKAGHNVVAMMEGTANAPSGRYIIVGAHFDNLGKMGGKIFPGADSNGSGVAVLLAIAKMASGQRRNGKSYGGNIIFVGFDGFYEGRKGGYALWQAIESGLLKNPVSGQTITKENIRMMIDLDQLGTSLEPPDRSRKDFLIAVGAGSLPTSRQRLLPICNKAYGFNMDLHYDYYGSDKFTDLFYRLGDRRFFIDNGIPTLFFTSGITDYNNSVNDKAETLDYGILKRRCLFIFRFIENIL